MKKTYIISIVCLMIDQIIKNILINIMDINDSITIIKNFFNITLVTNDGAAFSTFKAKTFFLILISVAVLIGLMIYIKKNKLKKEEYITYGVLLGGISGNLLDRINYSSVIDYLDFNIFGYPFPIFNFADICIVISMFLMIIMTFRREKHENKIKRI